MFMGEAVKLCPNLTVLHYDFEQYRDVSDAVCCMCFVLIRFLTYWNKIYGIFFESGAIVQPVSVDEAYLEFIMIEDSNPVAKAEFLREKIKQVCL